MISSVSFSLAQLQTLREAVLPETAAVGQELEETIFKSDPDQHDVLILSGSDDVFKSDSSLGEALAAKGVKVEENYDSLGVTSTVSSKQLQNLEKAGFRVFDNSARPMWALPAQTQDSPYANSNSAPLSSLDPGPWLELQSLHSQGLTGKGQRVAVLDSGFSHPSYQVSGWKDMVGKNTTPVDRVGHGTKVIHSVLRAAPDAEILAVRVMGDNGYGRPSDIVAGLKYVLDEHQAGREVDVVNLSLGDPPDQKPDVDHPLNRAVSALVEAGITVVAAAGNSGPKPGTIGSPAEAELALAVGSVKDPNNISAFSSRGPTEDGLSKPDVLAPGERLAGWSVPGSVMEQTALAVDKLRQMSGRELQTFLEEKPEVSKSLNLPSDVWETPAESLESLVRQSLPSTFMAGPGLVSAPGTSFAAPLVSGILLALEQERDLSPQSAQELLESTSTPLNDKSSLGAGLVNARQALEQMRRLA